MFIVFDGEQVAETYKELENKENQEKVKIVKSDPLSYRYYINFLKKEKPKITHLSSSFSYLPIFKYIDLSGDQEKDEDIIYKNEIYIGKPQGFYSFPFGFLNYKNAKASFNNSYIFFDKINDGIYNGVLNEDQLSFIHNINRKMASFIINIKYIAETMGSTLSVAQGTSMIKNNKKYAIISDAEIEMGEFYENLLLQKKYNFNITLLIDYNGWSKQNKTIIEIEDLKRLLEMFNQTAVIFDNRGFKEYFEKELK